MSVRIGAYMDLLKNLGDFNRKLDAEIKQHKNGAVHQLLAHSYLFYLLMMVVGLFVDMAWPVEVVPSDFTGPIGFGLLVLGSALIYWAQKTSANFAKNRRSKGAIYAEDFKHGPYMWSRNPTHIGLLLILVGFGFSENSLFLMLTPLLSFLVTYYVFIKREESILVERYKDEYLKYKNQVRTWF